MQDHERRRTLTEDEVRTIAREGAKEGIAEAFRTLGIDTSSPLEAQRDFAFLRDWRKSTEAVKRHGILTAIAVVVAGVLGLLWYAISGR